MSLRGQASYLGGKLTALACHPTKCVNKAEEQTFVSTNIVYASIQALSLEIKTLFLFAGLAYFGRLKYTKDLADIT
jgi:hypothetical protein